MSETTQRIRALMDRAEFWNRQCVEAKDAGDEQKFWSAHEEFTRLAKQINWAMETAE
jgi:hypothetical protein